MRQASRRLFSLTLTAIVSFLVPLLLIGALVLGLSGLQTLTLLTPVTQPVLQQLLHFLTTLGSGNPWHGVLIVGVASSMVGVLFDTFASSRFEGFSHH
jgi:fructose-specific phosphotransferase system IIC component